MSAVRRSSATRCALTTQSRTARGGSWCDSGEWHSKRTPVGRCYQSVVLTPSACSKPTKEQPIPKTVVDLHLTVDAAAPTDVSKMRYTMDSDSMSRPITDASGAILIAREEWLLDRALAMKQAVCLVPMSLLPFLAGWCRLHGLCQSVWHHR